MVTVEGLVSRIRLSVIVYPSGSCMAWGTTHYVQDLGYRPMMTERRSFSVPLHELEDSNALLAHAVEALRLR